ncbi:MAG: ABC transporter permease [Hydrogenophaga sp.]|uniref:ABC transporter permease n=1 Tax=Hydrogenophaga sp. TaxID=1904254 RepID=UPI0025802E09|nr:FtsX-like permease family protein [Hydrogenophaga sp.]MBL0943372.1 ABC transporter permease [Hydrogenophaga sp.]
MRALNLKLWRDLWNLRSQVLTIALVVAIGVGGFVGLFSVHASLLQARDDFYRSHRLADVFVSLKRAPTALAARVAAIDGVAEVQTGLAFDAQIDLGDPGAPVTGRFVALDLVRAPLGTQALNATRLREGRWPEAGPALEAVVSESFARARGLRPGARVHAVLNGRLLAVQVVGLAISPEYVFAGSGGAPDERSFGIWWVDARRLAELLDLRGAFNQAVLRLEPGASEPAVVAALDRLLEPYGSLGAVLRRDQLSARVVDDELDQLRVMGTVLPAIFLAVAMFILNGVLARQVATQRAQIASLKALGYGDGAIAAHYVGMALLVAGLGVVAGLALSGLIGRAMLGLYEPVFRFDALAYRTSAPLVGVAVAVAAAAAALGAWTAIRAVVRLRPAQAMQPPAPPAYRRTLAERLAPGARVRARALMVLRDVENRPWRSAFTVAGVAMAMALQIAGAFWLDAIAHIEDVQFRQVQPGNVVLHFQPHAAPAVAAELRRLPGVLMAEAYRSEPVRVLRGARSREVALTGLPPHAPLLPVVDARRGPVALPDEGIVLSQLLARDIGAQAGDRVTVAFRVGHREQVELPVVAVVHTLMGQQAWMSLPALHRATRDGAGLSDAALLVDDSALPAFWAAIKATPGVAAVFDKRSVQRAFDERTSYNMGAFSAILTLFAVAMAVGITYNAARIALSERAWDLASLRVLGMTRGEVSVLLLGQLAFELLLALPLGLLAGRGLAALLMRLMSSDNIEFPVVIAPATYAWAAIIVLAAGAASALLVRRRVDRFDLVAVLKVRE